MSFNYQTLRIGNKVSMEIKYLMSGKNDEIIKNPKSTEQKQFYIFKSMDSRAKFYIQSQIFY